MAVLFVCVTLGMLPASMIVALNPPSACKLEHEPREDAGVRVRDEDMPEDSSIIFCAMSRHVNINGYASHALRLPFFTFLSNIVSMISYMTLLPGMVLFWRASTISLLTPCSLQSLPLLELFNNIG